jgi:hypothetical protein
MFEREDNFYREKKKQSFFLFYGAAKSGGTKVAFPE